MKRRVISIFLILCLIVAVPIGVSAAEPPAGSGQLEIFGSFGKCWESLAVLNYTKDVSTQTLDIPEGVMAIKVVKLSGIEANLDELTLNGTAPFGYEKKLAATDNDLLEVAGEKVFAVTGSGELRVSARVSVTVPDTSCAFKFPESNLYAPITAESDFYRYALGDNKGSFAMGDALQIPNKAALFYNQMVYPGTGHPEAPMQIYLADDGETLYAFFEAFCDNTFDHGKDYAAVHIKDGSEVKTFAVHTTEENEYGRWYYDYTDNDANISWQHMCYVVAIPLAELKSPAAELELAFEYYGTAAMTTLQFLRIDGKTIGTIDGKTQDYPLPQPTHYYNAQGEDAATGTWWLYNDNGSYILTLNNAQLTTPCLRPGGGNGAGLVAWGNLDVVLAEGTTNTIGTSAMRSAMAMWGSVNSIKGEGTLNLYGESDGYVGSYGPLTIADATVNITASALEDDVNGISAADLNLIDAKVNIEASYAGESDWDAVYGVKIRDALTLDNSTLTVTTSGNGSGDVVALNLNGSNAELNTNQQTEYYQGDVAPGTKTEALTDEDINTGLQTKKYVKIVSYSDWTGQRADGKYRYADFSWLGDTVNNGEEATPYLIEDAQDLAGLAALVKAYDGSPDMTLVSALADGESANATNFSGKYIKLSADIDLSERFWTPIGITEANDGVNTFRGAFNGSGYIVRGLFMNNDLESAGLFGVNNGTVENLTVYVSSVKTVAENAYAGGLAGKNSAGIIRNCGVVLEGDIHAGTSQSENAYAGGLFGENKGNVTNCYVIGNGEIAATVNEMSPSFVGGLVGSNENAVANCYTSKGVSVKAEGQIMTVGAAFGRISRCRVWYCYYDKDATVIPLNPYGVGVFEDSDASLTSMASDEMKAEAFVNTLNNNVNEINGVNDNELLKYWNEKNDGYPVFTETRYFYNTPAAMIRNGITAKVSYSPTAAQAKDTVITATVTLTGTAVAPGKHTVNLTGAADGVIITPPSITTKTVTINEAMTAGDKFIFSFTLPEKNVKNLVLTHTFTELTSIAVNSTEHKTAYKVGDALDVTGLTIKATMGDNTDTTVAVTEDMVSGFDSSAAVPSQSLTITYQGKTTSFDITIAKNNPFTDVKESDYFYDAVLWAVDNNITKGTSDTTFSPAISASRGQVVTFLWRAYGSPEPTIKVSPFDDVQNSDAYYYKAVLWALEEGITSGTSAATFAPEKAATRGETLTLFWRACDKPVVTAVNPFTDVKEGDYFYNAVMWAYTEGITFGESANYFGAQDYCKRCQVVTFLYRGLANGVR